MVAPAAKAIDICDLTKIYNDRFSYCLDRKILRALLDGKVFAFGSSYTDEEKVRLNTDINRLYQEMVATKPVMGNLAAISAGAPGVGKATLLQRKLEAARAEGLNFAYICPDDVCLNNMKETYIHDMDASRGQGWQLQMAYAKWKPASNAAAHLLTAHIIKQKCAFYFGSTCSNPKTSEFFSFLRRRGYYIRVLYVNAPDDVRVLSIRQRDKTLVRTTEKDVLEKGILSARRLCDTLIRFVHEIEFYHRPMVDAKAIHAATWIKSSGYLPDTLKIHSKSDYERIKEQHNAMLEADLCSSNAWENTVGLATEI